MGDWAVKSRICLCDASIEFVRLGEQVQSSRFRNERFRGKSSKLKDENHMKLPVQGSQFKIVGLIPEP
jgi:hypothetical protein